MTTYRKRLPFNGRPGLNSIFKVGEKSLTGSKRGLKSFPTLCFNDLFPRTREKFLIILTANSFQKVS